MDDLWNIVFTQESGQECLRGLGIAVTMEENVEHGPVFVNRSPKLVGHSTHDHVHFIEMPPGTPAGFPVA